MEHGTECGEVCNRKGCMGVIELSETNLSCSCHINPPCSYCVDDRHYCPECNWMAIEEQKDYPIKGAQGLYNRMMAREENHADLINKKMKGLLPIDKLEYLIKPHTHFSMICEGVYPSGTTREDIVKKISSSFGGRFEYFRNNKFKYIAYTD